MKKILLINFYVILITNFQLIFGRILIKSILEGLLDLVSITQPSWIKWQDIRAEISYSLGANATTKLFYWEEIYIEMISVNTTTIVFLNQVWITACSNVCNLNNMSKVTNVRKMMGTPKYLLPSSNFLFPTIWNTLKNHFRYIIRNDHFIALSLYNLFILLLMIF